MSFSRGVSDWGDSTIDSGARMRARARLETSLLPLAAASSDCITAMAPLSRARAASVPSPVSTINTRRFGTAWRDLRQREKPSPSAS